MGERSVKKKHLILDKARELFVTRGFKDVTMKDIVEACGISRGGLYLYYSSTGEILKDILAIDSAGSDEALAEAFRQNAAPLKILELFLEAQKKELTSSKEALFMASYELASRKSDSESIRIRKQFDDAVTVLEMLIARGVRHGEMYSEDPHASAANIMFSIEGLKIMSASCGIQEREIDDVFRSLYTGLLYPEWEEEGWTDESELPEEEDE